MGSNPILSATVIKEPVFACRKSALLFDRRCLPGLILDTQMPKSYVKHRNFDVLMLKYEFDNRNSIFDKLRFAVFIGKLSSALLRLMRAMAMKSLKIPAVLFFSLWLSACAQTAANTPTEPPPEETKQSAPTGSPASSASAETGQPDARQKSEAGKASAAGSTETQKKEPGSTAAAGPQAKQTPATSGNSQIPSPAAAQDSAESKLSEARENLHLGEQTEKRIAADLEQLKKSGTASDAAIRDYENYLGSVQAITAENRKVVAQMEAAYANKPPDQAGSDAPAANELQRPANPEIPEEQTLDEVAVLDRQLDASLAKFDDMLLKEMKKIQSESSGKLQQLAQEAAESAKRLREKGLAVDTSGSKSGANAEKEPEGEPESGRDKASAEGKSGTETVSRDGSRKGGSGPSSTDQHRTAYEDDDIVARQLREAAENETDPELKAKLWKEYEEYKKSK